MGKQYRVRCKGLDHKAHGEVMFNNKKFAVPYLLPKELGVMELVYKKEETGAKLCEVIESSKDRVTPDCPYFGRCGGCQLSHMTKEAQAVWKQGMVQDLLKQFGTCEPMITMEDSKQYRHKIYATFSYAPSQNKEKLQKGKKHTSGSRKIISGIYEEESHQVVAAERCLIQHERGEAILKTIRQVMQETKTMPYEEDKERGCLRHAYIRIGRSTGQIMVALVTGTKEFPMRAKFVEALTKKHPDITTILWNVNTKKTSMVLGEKDTVLYGDGFIEDSLCGLTFRISSKSFFQVNPVQTERLYEKAMELAKLSGTERVFDAYCGTGTIGLIAAKQAKEVVGVELNKDAVRDAELNKKRNQLQNARFYAGDAGEFLEKEAAEKQKFDVIFMDPPRSGSSEKFLNSVAKIAPKKVVYISCNPETLQRDLVYLTKQGYKVENMVPVDMFPETVHVEVIVSLCRGVLK